LDTSKKILVVEDSDLQREICVHQLKGLGFENVSSAKDGFEAHAFLENNPVDLIISDWEMPEMDGIELLKKTKSDPQLKKIPFLILTIHEKKEANMKMIELGAFDYMMKPATPEVLNEKLQYIFGNKRKETDRRQDVRRKGDRRNPKNTRRG